MSRHFIRILPAILFALVFGLAGSNSARAQGPGGPGGFFGGGNSLFMLRDEAIQKELELVPDQVEKLTALGDKMREEMQQMFSGGQGQSREDREARFNEIREKMRERTEKLQKDVDDILLPHQQKRLAQLSRQQRMRGFGGGGVNTDVLGSELKLTDEQKEKLKERAQEVEKKLREKVSKIRREAEDELLSVLTPEQRAQWKEMIGEPFEFPQPQFRRPGGDRGGDRRGGGSGTDQTRRPNN